MTSKQDNDDILKIVAREWKALSDRDRAHWDEEARNDKVRYVVFVFQHGDCYIFFFYDVLSSHPCTHSHMRRTCAELSTIRSIQSPDSPSLLRHYTIRFVREKAAYKGPWAIPKRRAKKHPLAPKRPMSAFLKYSQTRRAKVKEDNPDMSNTDVSRLLGEMWRNASPKERAPYVEQEERERAIYKEDIKKWRDDQARMDAASRTSHQTVQNYRHRPQPATTYERSYPSGSSSFENLHMDSFEEPQKKPAFRPLYGNTAYPTYRQGYNTHPPPPPPPGRLSSGLGNEKKRNQNWTYNTFQLTPQNAAPELSLQHSSDYHDMDSLQVPRPPLPPPQMEEDESMDGHYLPPRSSYFSENMGLGHHYSRYP